VSQELANQYPLSTPVKVRARDLSPASDSLDGEKMQVKPMVLR
jgi:hypothetical protein